MEKGERLWYIVGYYLSPGDGTTIWYMEAAMADRPRGAELIVAGNFNMYQENTGGWGWDKEITEAVIKERLEDIQGHFLPQRQVWCKERSTWAMVKQGRAVRSRTDYILVSDLRIFQNMSVWYPRHNSDYLMVIGCLNGAPPPREHSRYLGCRTRLLIRPPVCQTRIRADKIFGPQLVDIGEDVETH